MTLLSITASFGALVWIFQEGNLSGPAGLRAARLHHRRQPDHHVRVIFGLSMDYEVLLLSRIQEAYRRTGDNTASVAEGLAEDRRRHHRRGPDHGHASSRPSPWPRSSRSRASGSGMAIAVAVDATIIRVLLVPATMRLMGRWNWWAPGFLGRFVDRLGFSHVEDDLPPVTADRTAEPAARLDSTGDIHPRNQLPWTNSPSRDSVPTVGAARPETGSRASTSTAGSGVPTRTAGPGCRGSAIFLLVFGALLLIQQAFPQAQSAGSVVVLAVGLAFLVKWAIDRGTGSLYAGAFLITALAVPGRARTRPGSASTVDGIGTFCFGVAFLFIAVVRAVQRRRLGLAALVRRPARADRRRRTSRARPSATGRPGVADRARRRAADAERDARSRLGPSAGLAAPAPVEATASTASSTASARTAATRWSSASVITKGGPSRIVSPFVPSAMPVPE